MASYFNSRTLVLFGLALALTMALTCPVAAQTPESCITTGLSGYSYTTTNDGTNTTLHFTFYNRSPIDSIYVNIGEVFFSGLPAPIATTSPTGWQFNHIGPRLFFSTTSNPWWKTPPALAPGESLSGFDYTIAGLVVPTFIVFTHVQNVTDATGSTAGPLGSWFDCSVIVTPPVDEPCIGIIKTAIPAAGITGTVVTYGIDVKNCGNVALTVTSLSDTLMGNLLPNFLAANGGSAVLAVGQTVSFTVNRTILVTDPDVIPNTVSVSGTPPTGPPVTASADASVIHIQAVPGPHIQLTKIVYPTSAQVGQQVTYTYELCNTGEEDLDVTSLTDTIIGDILSNFIAANGGSSTLAIGECVTFDVVFTIPNVPTGPYFNCAMVDTAQGATDEFCARVDVTPASNTAQCFLPVTLTEEGWHDFFNQSNPIMQSNLSYNKFALAFKQFSFYGTIYSNRIIVGNPATHTLTFTGTTFGLTHLRNFLPQANPLEFFPLLANNANPTGLLDSRGMPTTNALAGEALALTLNIGFNDMRLMPRTPGYDLEKFTLTSGIFKGKTVGYVLDIANKVLGGAQPTAFGLPGNYIQGVVILGGIIDKINANYEFVGYKIFIDRGFLKPNRPFGQPGPAHMPTVP